MDGRADGQLDVVAARDLDRLGALLERHQCSVAPVLVALDALDVQVGDIGGEVREPPGDLLVVADDDAGKAGEREASHVERALLAHRRALQLHLVPDRGQRGPEVRIVREQGHPGFGEVSGDDPGVRADALADIADQHTRRFDHARGLLPLDGRRCLLRLAVGLGGGVGRRLRIGAECGNGRDLGHDHGVLVERVVGIELRQQVTGGRVLCPVRACAQLCGQQRAFGLVLDVAAQVPGHGLEPGDGIRGFPRLGSVVGVLQSDHGVLERQFGAGARSQVGVHAIRIGLVVAARGVVHRLDLGLRDRAPSERAEEGVGAGLRLPEHLGDAAGGHMAAEVHLEEPVLRVHEALRVEQVVGRVGGDRRDTAVVALHGDRGREPVELDRSLGLREGTLDGPGHEERRSHGDHHDGGHDEERDAPDANAQREAGRGSGLLRIGHHRREHFRVERWNSVPPSPSARFRAAPSHHIRTGARHEAFHDEHRVDHPIRLGCRSRRVRRCVIRVTPIIANSSAPTSHTPSTARSPPARAKSPPYISCRIASTT